MRLRFIVACSLAVTLCGKVMSAQELPPGQIIEDVRCQQDDSQHYALYLPSYFDGSRQWPVILAFDAGGRGRQAVERYKDGAEKYGYLVLGSNNSRNGPWQVGLDAAAAMSAEAKRRFAIDPKRMYTAGMSGGARVAIMVAENSNDIAGVLASSAGYSTSFHKSQRFVLFGSAGTEDFNFREMRAVDRLMTSPHRVEIFEGGHSWLPVDMATRGVEWMEIQAMRKRLRPRDQKLIDELFSKRVTAAEAQAEGLVKFRELKQVIADFEGLHDVAQVVESAKVLEGRRDVAAAAKTEEDEDDRELKLTNEIDAIVRQLGWPEKADAAFTAMKSLVSSLLDIARREPDSPDRRIARRVLAGLRASRAGVPNPQFQEFIRNIQIPAPPQVR